MVQKLLYFLKQKGSNTKTDSYYWLMARLVGCPLLGVAFKTAKETSEIRFVLQMTVLTVYVFLYGKVYLVCEQYYPFKDPSIHHVDFYQNPSDMKRLYSGLHVFIIQPVILLSNI